MSEPNWRELGDPWADRLPPEPRSEVSFRHAHRLAQTRRMSSLTFTSATCGYSLGHRNRHQCDCVCVRPAGHDGPHQCSAEAVQP